MVVGWCWLRVDCSVVFVVCCSLFSIRWLSFVVSGSLCTVVCILSGVFLLVVCYCLFVVCCLRNLVV